MRRAHGDNISFEYRIADIVIPVSGGDGTDLFQLVKDDLGPNQGYYERIISWEVIENAAAFHAGVDSAALTDKFLVRATNAGLNLAVSRQSLEDTFVRSTTAGTVAAKVILYLADENVLWSTPED